MIKNYLRTAFRFFKRSKGYTFINISGLSIGIAVSIVGFLFVIHELSFDKFHKNSDRIYRIAVDALSGNTAIYQTYTSAPYAAALYEFFPKLKKLPGSEHLMIMRLQSGTGSSWRIMFFWLIPLFLRYLIFRLLKVMVESS
nr:ABC transporter permease [Bacteroidota bacterium]